MKWIVYSPFQCCFPIIYLKFYCYPIHKNGTQELEGSKIKLVFFLFEVAFTEIIVCPGWRNASSKTSFLSSFSITFIKLWDFYPTPGNYAMRFQRRKKPGFLFLFGVVFVGKGPIMVVNMHQRSANSLQFFKCFNWKFESFTSFFKTALRGWKGVAKFWIFIQFEVIFMKNIASQVLINGSSQTPFSCRFSLSFY